MPQDTCLDIFQVKLPSACQLVCQGPSQLNSKEGTQLKCQRNFQVLIQGPNQLILQIESSRDPRGFPRDMLIIIPVIPGFGYSNRDSSESTTEKEATFGVNIQKYHDDNGDLNTGSVSLVLNIKTGYNYPQFRIAFEDYFTTTSARITSKIPDNWDNTFNNHCEPSPEEFQFSIGKKWKTPTDRSEGYRKANNNSTTDCSEGYSKAKNNSPTDH